MSAKVTIESPYFVGFITAQWSSIRNLTIGVLVTALVSYSIIIFVLFDVDHKLDPVDSLRTENADDFHVPYPRIWKRSIVIDESLMNRHGDDPKAIRALGLKLALKQFGEIDQLANASGFNDDGLLAGPESERAKTIANLTASMLVAPEESSNIEISPKIRDEMIQLINIYNKHHEGSTRKNGSERIFKNLGFHPGSEIGGQQLEATHWLNDVADAEEPEPIISSENEQARQFLLIQLMEMLKQNDETPENHSKQRRNGAKNNKNKNIRQSKGNRAKNDQNKRRQQRGGRTDSEEYVDFDDKQMNANNNQRQNFGKAGSKKSNKFKTGETDAGLDISKVKSNLHQQKYGGQHQRGGILNSLINNGRGNQDEM